MTAALAVGCSALLILGTTSGGAIAAEPPLAIPYAGERPPPPPLDPERARAIREYRARHLRVVPLAELHAFTAVSYGGAWDPWGPGWTDVVVATPVVDRIDTWGVLRGPERLDTLAYLAAIGRPDERRDLDRRVRANRTLGSALVGIGVVGVGTTLVSLVGMDEATRYREYHAWRRVSAVGVVAMAGGFVAASFPTSRARRLLWRPSTTRSLEQVQAEVQEHNERLRAELGLSADEALRVESPRVEPPRGPDR